MCNWLKHLLLSFLIVSLPVQGIAAGARFDCGAHQSSKLEQKQLPHRLVDSTTVPDDVTAVDHTSERTSVANSREEDCENTELCKPSRCSACTACCIPACAPPPGSGASMAQAGTDGVPQLSFSSFTEYISARLERPPRLT